MNTFGFVVWVIVLGAIFLFFGVGVFAFTAILSFVTGMWLLGHKLRIGFVFVCVGSVILLLKAILHQEIAMFCAFGTVAWMSAINYRKWGS